MAASALMLLAPLAAPPAASAHGVVGRTSLSVPAWLFAWAAAAVLVVSFVGLGRLWSSPRLARAQPRLIARLPAGVQVAAGAVGVTFYALVVLSGAEGDQAPSINLAPTAVFILLWVAVPMVSAVLGDVFSLVNPWLALARAGRWVWQRRGPERSLPPPLSYPEAAGCWPAVAGILAFAWLELVFVGRQHPATLAVLGVAYAVVQLAGMALYGIERWSSRGDAFGVLFGLYARLAPLELREREVWRRPPLSGLASLDPVPGIVALVLAAIGATTFDGLLNGALWRTVLPWLRRALGHLGLGGTVNLEAAQTLGLIACLAACAGLYWLGVRGMASITRWGPPGSAAVDPTGSGAADRPAVAADRPAVAADRPAVAADRPAVAADRPAVALARAFAPSLTPIAFGYLVAHYFSLLIIQGQATAYLISDPFGTGANLFGTAGARIDPGIVSAAAIWYVQVAALVCGHVGGLALAHDRALVVFGQTTAAGESQRWMLVVMVTFTCLGLWLLSAVNT